MTMISINFSPMLALALVALQVITMPDAVGGADYTYTSLGGLRLLLNLDEEQGLILFEFHIDRSAPFYLTRLAQGRWLPGATWYQEPCGTSLQNSCVNYLNGIHEARLNPTSSVCAGSPIALGIFEGAFEVGAPTAPLAEPEQCPHAELGQLRLEGSRHFSTRRGKHSSKGGKKRTQKVPTAMRRRGHSCTQRPPRTRAWLQGGKHAPPSPSARLASAAVGRCGRV